jgi:RNA polymerase sigma-70 factor (ECF subfamily)
LENFKTEIHRELLAECENGNKKAQFEIYKLYYKAMYNTCLRMVNRCEDAEDIMQESFLAAFQNLRNRREEASFGAWLKRITINKCLDFLKLKKIQFSDFNENFDIPEEIQNENNEQNINLEIIRIKEAVTQLKDNYRIVFNLKVFEGYDHEETAKILNIKPSTARSIFTRAKIQLTEILNQQ